jgi:HEAT repeat protein
MMTTMFERTLHNLTSSDPAVRYEAARMLGDSTDQRAVAALLEALNDEHAKTQYAAFSSLIKIGDTQAAAPIVDHLLTVTNSRLWELLKLNIGMRLRAGLLDLIRQGDLVCADRLIAALDDQRYDELQRAFFTLLAGKTGDSRPVEALIEMLMADTDPMKAAAAKALGWIGDHRAVAPLLIALNDSEPQSAVREVAAEALGRIGDPSAVSALVYALNDDNEWVRRAAAVALGDLGDRVAIEPLTDAMGDESVMVQDAAFESLKKLSSSSFTTIMQN